MRQRDYKRLANHVIGFRLGVWDPGFTGYFVPPKILYPPAKYPRIYRIPLGYLVPPHTQDIMHPHTKYPSTFCTPPPPK